MKDEGWQVELVYLALPSVQMSKQRVAERVKHGGHNIPVKDIERRFARSLRNLLQGFSFIADSCTCYMNNNDQPEPIFEQQGEERNVLNPEYYQHLLQEAKA